jgi:ipoprotein LpqH
LKYMIVAVTVAALMAGGSAGCSSDPPPAKPKRGTSPPGTARITIDGKDAGTTTSVECGAVGSRTTIRTGDETSGVTILLSDQSRLTVELVRIRNLDGFSGDYNAGLGDQATAALTESTYHISGTALGYRSPESIAVATQPFAVEVTC